jgi:spore germination protein KC
MRKIILPKQLLILLLIISLLPTGGCFDRRDIERRTFVLAVAIDSNNEEAAGFEITVQLANTYNIGRSVGGGEGGGDGGDGKAVEVITTRGKNLASMLNKIETMIDNPLSFGHSLFLIISKEIATEGVYDYLDYFLRNPRFRRKAWLLIAPEKAKDILTLTPSLHPVPPLYVIRALDSLSNMNAIPITRIEEFIIALNCPAEQPVAVIIEPAGQNIKLGGLAAFQDDRVVGVLNPAETTLFLFLKQDRKEGIVQLENPETKETEIIYEIYNTSSKVKPRFNDEQISFTIDLWVEGNIVEKRIPTPLDDDNFIQHLERRLTTKLTNDIQKLITKIQKELQTDILHLGEIVRAYYPHYWDQVDWQELFPQIPIKIQVTTNIRRTGMRLE